jgi:fructokinase
VSAAVNALVALARCGMKTAFIGKVGNDMHGQFLKKTLEETGISTEGLIVDPSIFTTMAFVAINNNGEHCFSFTRNPGADTMLTVNKINTRLIQSRNPDCSHRTFSEKHSFVVRSGKKTERLIANILNTSL